jgi:hypothetical protein
MKWQDYLNRAEREELEAAEQLRNQARDVYNKMRIKLKNRCEQRMRRDDE